MKRKRYAVIIAITTMAMYACGEQRKDQNEQTAVTTKAGANLTKVTFADETTTAIFDAYIAMKSALTASDAKGVKISAMTLNANIGADGEMIKNIVSQVDQTEDLEVQRALFSELTARITPYLKDRITEGKIYRQYCPMAFNNTGGYWLSTESEIRNPYFGDKMLTCGTVRGTIQ